MGKQKLKPTSEPDLIHAFGPKWPNASQEEEKYWKERRKFSCKNVDNFYTTSLVPENNMYARAWALTMYVENLLSQPNSKESLKILQKEVGEAKKIRYSYNGGMGKALAKLEKIAEELELV